MKKRTIEYKEEPANEGWRFDAGAKPLGKAAQKALGIPGPAAAGTSYERTEEGGKVVMQPQRGGKRAGAGRKASNHVRLHLLVPAETKEQLQKLAARDHVTLSEAFRRTISAL